MGMQSLSPFSPAPLSPLLDALQARSDCCQEPVEQSVRSPHSSRLAWIALAMTGRASGSMPIRANCACCLYPELLQPAECADPSVDLRSPAPAAQPSRRWPADPGHAGIEFDFARQTHTVYSQTTREAFGGTDRAEEQSPPQGRQGPPQANPEHALQDQSCVEQDAIQVRTVDTRAMPQYFSASPSNRTFKRMRSYLSGTKVSR